MKHPSPRQRDALALVADGKFYPDLVKEDDGWHARWRALGADNEWVDEYVRGPSVTVLSEDAEDQRHETLHDAWAMALRSRTGLVRWDDAECAAFAAELAEWHGGGSEDVEARRALCFSFHAASDSSENAFTLSCPRPKGRAQYRALGQAVCVWGGLRGLRSDGYGRDACPHASAGVSPRRPCQLVARLSKGEAEDFIRRGARELADAGYSVSGVDLAATVSAVAEIDGGVADVPRDDEKKSVRLKIKVAGEEVSAEEIRFLLEQNSTLVFFRDRWIEVDRGILREALRALEKSEKTKSNPLSFALGIGAVGRMEVEEVLADGGILGLLNRLRQSHDGAANVTRGGVVVEIPRFEGTLRDYQSRGVDWISFLTDNGFGALLADDMGLGKTIQTIAWILRGHLGRGRSPSGPRSPRRGDPTDGCPFLVVAPLTLLSNWRHEFAKFAPTLRVYVHQGDMRHVGSGFKKAAAEADVVVTSYALIVRDHREFAEVEWDGIVLDEAQAIKNPDTHAARAIRALGVRRRLALTGTPIENGVADIWSLEEFLNPGLLGDRKSFADRFVKPLATDPCSAQGKKLRRALEPFVLRRLKSDPAVAGELGEKREIREYCALAPAERAEYERALADYRAGERRQGDIFALLTRLKLACDGFDGEAVAGGKVDRLVELVETIFENGESVLIFSQYAKVGEALKKMLERRFSQPIAFLHGGLSAAQREEQIALFDGTAGPAAFVLSLRAGGFGLNLTKATHVIHFDRWWNPAVEGQATDRAHRIGQEKPVFVHVFVTEGTVEERVEEILERKESLAGLLKDGEKLWNAIGLADA
jgi:superfamily II DNA or RNA helicase